MKNFQDDLSLTGGKLAFVKNDGDTPIEYNTDQLTTKYLDERIKALRLFSTTSILLKALQNSISTPPNKWNSDYQDRNKSAIKLGEQLINEYQIK